MLQQIKNAAGQKVAPEVSENDAEANALRSRPWRSPWKLT